MPQLACSRRWEKPAAPRASRVPGSGGHSTLHGAALLQVLFQLNLKTTRGRKQGPKRGRRAERMVLVTLASEKPSESGRCHAVSRAAFTDGSLPEPRSLPSSEDTHSPSWGVCEPEEDEHSEGTCSHQQLFPSLVITDQAGEWRSWDLIQGPGTAHPAASAPCNPHFC